MNFERSSGILLHPTSLPGPYGIGDLGPQAHAWIDFLADHDSNLWQVLPIGPTGYGDSPYQSFSAFAGNPYLISPEALLAEGLVDASDIATQPRFPTQRLEAGPAGPVVRLFQRSRQPGANRSLPPVPGGAGCLAGRFRPIHGAQGCTQRGALAYLGT